MAIFHKKFLTYLSTTLTGAMNTRKPAFTCDRLFALIEGSRGFPTNFGTFQISEKDKDEASGIFRVGGVVGVIEKYFTSSIIEKVTDTETERQVIALKKGFPGMPATTCSIIIQGFGKGLSEDDVLRIYASHGLTRGMRELAKEYDFVEINRRTNELSQIIDDPDRRFEYAKRYEAMHNYIQSEPGEQERAIRQSNIKRSLFFHYWKRFCRYGLLGLADSGTELFRAGKVGMVNEARIIIGKLQNPQKGISYFVNQLATKGIKIYPSSISMIFRRWDVKAFKSEFKDNLQRLESGFKEESDDEQLTASANPIRLVDGFYPSILQGLAEFGMPTDAPGLFLIWAYLEKLNVFPVFHAMGLTSLPEGQRKGYSWFDLFLLNVGRIFYGIDNYSKTCEHSEPTLPFFAGMVKSPCNDTFLDGLEGKITEKEAFRLRQWLVKRVHELGLINMKKVALDFHQIDMDVVLDKIRKFGKGPSPQKKICYNGFRPHIAWDLETGCLIAAEFRKSSARGTTTAIPFVKDYLTPELNDCFESVYIDSEYTGKDVWQFILGKNGMNADLTACLKQNAFVKKARDNFLQKYGHDNGFWLYYDDEHVYSSSTFDLKWKIKKDGKEQEFHLKSLVKKNTKNGSLRCFGSSKTSLNSREILADYSKRWVIENGIKDLIGSYYVDNCPGARPHLADVHFLIVSICRMLYKMIVDELGEDYKNPDGTVKTLSRMREMLFRQGAGKVFFRNNTFEIEFMNAFPIPMNRMLNKLFRKISEEYANGLTILGGAKLSFKLKVPHGDENRNSLEKVPLSLPENF